MWEFPAVEVGGADAGPDAVMRGVGRLAADPAVPQKAVELPAVTHRFSHFTGVYRPYRIEVAGEWRQPEGLWVTPSELADMALPVAQQRIARAAGL